MMHRYVMQLKKLTFSTSNSIMNMSGQKEPRGKENQREWWVSMRGIWLVSLIGTPGYILYNFVMILHLGRRSRYMNKSYGQENPETWKWPGVGNRNRRGPFCVHIRIQFEWWGLAFPASLSYMKALNHSHNDVTVTDHTLKSVDFLSVRANP